MATKLDATQRVILRAFRSLDPKGEYSYNAWAPFLDREVRSEGRDVEGFNSGWQRELTSLVRRGLLGAEGRGTFRSYWITDKGLAAIAEPE